MKRVQHVRHTPQDADEFTGEEGEITVVTETFEIRVHDGQTAGGYTTLTRAIADTLYVTQTNFEAEIEQLIEDLTELNDDAIEQIISNIIIAKGPVIDILTGPPGSPAEGDRYLIASGGTSGAYIGHEDEIVEYVDDTGTAIFSGTPEEGHQVFVQDENVIYYYDDDSGTWGTTSLDNTYLTRQTALDAAIALKANIDSPALTGTPTAPTAAQGTDTTQIATTAFVNDAVAGAEISFDSDLSSNGYQHLPSGMIMQWGIYAGGSANPTISFPTAFPSSCFGVQITPIGSSGDTDDASDASTNPAIAQIQTITDSSFTARLSRESGARDVFHSDFATDVTFYWFAYGN